LSEEFLICIQADVTTTALNVHFWGWLDAAQSLRSPSAVFVDSSWSELQALLKPATITL